MVATTWTLSLREQGQGSDTDVVVNGLEGAFFGLSRGSTVTRTLTFRSDLLGVATDNRTRYETVRKLLTHAGAGDRGIDGNGDPYWQERLPASAPVASQVVKLVPDTTLDVWPRGIWAVVIGGQELDPVGDTPSLELELFVLTAVRAVLVVPSGETYTVPSGETREFSDTDVDGTLDVQGTLDIQDSTYETRSQLKTAFERAA